MEKDEDIVSLLLFLAGECDDDVKPEEIVVALVPVSKKKHHPPRLTMRKYDRKKRKERNGVPVTPSPLLKRKIRDFIVPNTDEIFEVSWKDNLYYDCKVIDFIQVDNRMYYDIQYIEDGIIVENVDARHVYPARSCRKLPKRM